jgi:hypothetical protein
MDHMTYKAVAGFMHLRMIQAKLQILDEEKKELMKQNKN